MEKFKQDVAQKLMAIKAQKKQAPQAVAQKPVAAPAPVQTVAAPPK